MKLAVCTPHANPYCLGSWAYMVHVWLKLPKNSIFLRTQSQPVATARNALTVKALQSGATHLLWVDDDIFPKNPEAFQMLYEQDKDIISALCKYRTPLDKWVCKPAGVSLVESVKEVGMGFTLVKAQVYLEMAGSYDLQDVQFYRWAGSTVAPTSEDVSFCRMAKVLGFDSFIHNGVLCGHADTVVFDDSEKGFTQLRPGIKPKKGPEKMEVLRGGET